MQSLRDGVHDERLHHGPVIDDLAVPEAQDGVAEQSQCGVVRVVRCPLIIDVVAAVELDDQAIADRWSTR